MAWCPFAYKKELREARSFRKGANGDILRIVVHHTGVSQSRKDYNHAVGAWNEWTRNAQAAKGPSASAHFVIEPNGVITQTVDTADIAFGTATTCGHAVHIEHGGSGDPFTNSQFWSSAYLIAWVKSLNPNLSLEPVGTGIRPGEFGDKNQRGITCHAFSDLAGIAAKDQYAPKAPKLTCPGEPMMNALKTLSTLAKFCGPWVQFIISPEQMKTS